MKSESGEYLFCRHCQMMQLFKEIAIKRFKCFGCGWVLVEYIEKDIEFEMDPDDDWLNK